MFWYGLLVISEVTDLDTGLLLEVWEKGMLWDKAIGYYWCPLNTIPFTKQVGHTHNIAGILVNMKLSVGNKLF